jgi:phosphoribosylformylglycinamidine synthase
MKVGVKILPKNEVLDSQGRAVENTLRHNGRGGVSCRVGRYVQLEIDAKSADEARAKAKDIVDFVLHNPLIETYQIELL